MIHSYRCCTLDNNDLIVNKYNFLSIILSSLTVEDMMDVPHTHPLILERTNERRLEAKAQGIRFGRKPTIDQVKLRHLKAQGLGATAIARQMNIGRTTVYKLLKSTKSQNLID